MTDKHIEYVLIARINGQQVFHGRYADTYEVQEIGLNEAEDTVSMYLDSDDLEPEELSYIHTFNDRRRRKKLRGKEDE